VRCFHDAESKFADVCSDVVNPAPFSPSCRSRVVQSGIELSMVWVDPWVGFGWVTRNGHPWTTLVWHRRFDVVVGVTRFHQVSHQSAALRQTEIPARSRRRTSRQICVTTRAATASSDALRAANSTSSRSSSSSSSPSPSQSDIIRGFKGRGQVGHAPRTCPPPNKFHEGPSGASRMQENLLAAGARLGTYSAPPDLLAGHSSTTLLLLSGPRLFGPMALAHLARP